MLNTDIATCSTCGQPMRATDLIAHLTEENEALRKDAERRLAIIRDAVTLLPTWPTALVQRCWDEINNIKEGS